MRASGTRVVLVQVDGHGFDAGAILGRRIDPLGPSAFMRGPAGARRANFLVGNDSHAQLGQLEDLPCLNHFMRLHLQVTDAALGGCLMGDGLIDCGALAQRVASVALLAAVGTLT